MVATRCIALTIISLLASNASSTTWHSYSQEGQLLWGGLCTGGLLQSPIAINTSKIVQPTVNTADDLLYTRLPEGKHPLQLTAPDKVKIINTGATLKVNPIPTLFGAKDFGSIDLPAGRFSSKEFEFHFPAEHKIVVNSATSDPEIGELQIMFENAETGGYMGLSILLRAVEYTTSMLKRHIDFFENMNFKRNAQDLFHNGEGLPIAAGDTIEIDKKIDMVKTFLPDLRGNYYHYTGSLTSPPCTEGVHWYVMQSPINVTWSMLRNAKDAILEAGKLQAAGNNRALQPSQGRKVILDALATDQTDPVLGPKAISAAAAPAIQMNITLNTTQIVQNMLPFITSTVRPTIYAGSSGSGGSSSLGFSQPSSGSSASLTTLTLACIAFGCCCCLLVGCGIAAAVRMFDKKKSAAKRKEYFPPLDLEDEKEYDPLAQTKFEVVSKPPPGSEVPLQSYYQSPAESPVVAAPNSSYYQRPVAPSAAGYAPAAKMDGPSSSYYQRPVLNR